MAQQKLYAGTKLRELRARVGLTQKEFAAKLSVSLPYLNQMENNHRPVSAAVVLGLAHEFGLDVTELSTGDAERLVSDMREALADPLFADVMPPLADLRLASSNAPTLVHAFLALHQTYRQSQERLAALDDALGRDGVGAHLSPWEEVRDFFHYCDNYIDAVDVAAERFATLAGGDVVAHATAELGRLGITIAMVDDGPLRRFDPARQEIQLSRRAPKSRLNFQLLLQMALITQSELFDATLDLARFHSPEARDIAKIGLANYFAGAALLPYDAFLNAAGETRHDLELMAERFGTSIEQVAHRLSCSGQMPRGYRFSSCAWIRQAPSPSVIRPRACNLPALAAHARFGMCTALSKRRAGSCDNWPKRRMGSDMFASRAPYRRPAVPLPRRSKDLQSVWDAKSATPRAWSMPTGWI